LYSDIAPVPSALATLRIDTPASPSASASATATLAISARECAGAGPRAPRSGRSQISSESAMTQPYGSEASGSSAATFLPVELT
jgi:hypothetical protein